MDPKRKKELSQQYKQMKKDMGIYTIKSKASKICYLEATNDLKGTMNGAQFKLDMVSHPNRSLQKNWKELGRDNFTMEILEHLAYDEDESKTDYSEELALLKMIWEEKLSKENWEFYLK